MKVQEMNIDEIKPYENNPRVNDKSVDDVAESIKEFGWQQPIVVDKDNVIIVGHTRWKAAKKLGMKKVPVVVASSLTPEQVKAYRLADNKVSEESIWDNKKLLDELDELNKIDEDVFTGFSESDIFDDVLNESLNDVLKDNEEGVTYNFSCKTQNKELYEKLKEVVKKYDVE